MSTELDALKQKLASEGDAEREARIARASRDPHRPRYHFQPPPSWINDPIPFYANGEYHVYYQYNPGQPYWGNMNWGHAVSLDLVRWEDLPIALAPTPDSPDAWGIFTGCVIERDGLFHALYTGVLPPVPNHLPQTQCLATSRDLLTWEKYAGNPVISEAQKPAGYGDTFRDPHVWREADGWYMVIGGVKEEAGVAFLYRSADLVTWEYLHVLYEGPAARDECPDFFPLGDKYVLISSRGQTAWAVGTYANHRFTPEAQGIVDYGQYYASKTLLDGQGRRILCGWVREGRPVLEQCKAGWSGAFALPRVLTLLPDNTLGMEPAPELRALRGRRHTYGNLQATEGLNLLNGVEANCVEILAHIEVNSTTATGIAVLCSPEGEEETPIIYDGAAGTLLGAPLSLTPGEDLALRVFVDRSVIEVYANGRYCNTVRSYPGRADSMRIGLVVRGGRATVKALDIWELNA